MKKILYFVGFGILLCTILDASGTESAGTLKRVSSKFNVRDVTPDTKSKSIYRKIDAFCENNKLDGVSEGESLTALGLYFLAEKIGYQVRKTAEAATEEERKYYVVDISWPVIKEYAKKVTGEHPETAETPEMESLKELLRETENISKRADDGAKTQITPEQKSLILGKCNVFFDLSELSPENQSAIKEIFSMVLDNYSGYQRMMSVLTVGLLNSGDKGFVLGFTKRSVQVF